MLEITQVIIQSWIIKGAIESTMCLQEKVKYKVESDKKLKRLQFHLIY